MSPHAFLQNCLLGCSSRGPLTGSLKVRLPVRRECVALVRELGCPVEHIVLPTFAVEHKLFVGPFSRAFPRARVHVAPRWLFLPTAVNTDACGSLHEWVFG
jgi:hypothetical protein